MKLRLSPEVERALKGGSPVVALESSVLAQGLPQPENAQAATQMTTAIRDAGACPAISAVVAGVPTLGVTDSELARFLRRDGVRKLSARDLPVAIAGGWDGATTVAGALVLCRAGGIAVFATGGIGGVHLAPPFDESADLVELARTPVIVVCAGAKSILNLAATVERLETLGISVVGYRTDDFPGFFFAASGFPVMHRVDDVREIIQIHRASVALGRRAALLIVQPPPTAHAIAREEIEAAVAVALAEARRHGVRGAATTPFLLSVIERATEGKSLRTNLALLESNARLGGEIAVELGASHL